MIFGIEDSILCLIRTIFWCLQTKLLNPLTIQMNENNNFKENDHPF